MKKNISTKQLKEFGLLIGFGLPIIVGWIIPATGGHLFKSWTLWIGFPFCALALTKPFLLYYPYKLWMLLGHTLGWINSRIILGLVFILILQPIAFIMKIFGYDPLRDSQMERKKSSFRESIKDRKIDLTRIF